MPFLPDGLVSTVFWPHGHLAGMDHLRRMSWIKRPSSHRAAHTYTNTIHINSAQKCRTWQSHTHTSPTLILHRNAEKGILDRAAHSHTQTSSILILHRNAEKHILRLVAWFSDTGGMQLMQEQQFSCFSFPLNLLFTILNMLKPGQVKTMVDLLGVWPS